MSTTEIISLFSALLSAIASGLARWATANTVQLHSRIALQAKSEPASAASESPSR
jgi:hypothetical protein